MFICKKQVYALFFILIEVAFNLVKENNLDNGIDKYPVLNKKITKDAIEI